MFDGNIHSISGDYWYDRELNRAVAVDPAIIFEALRKVYKANELLKELGTEVAGARRALPGQRAPSAVLAAACAARRTSYLHLVLHLQRAEQRAEGREPELALPERPRRRHGQRARRCSW